MIRRKLLIAIIACIFTVLFVTVFTMITRFGNSPLFTKQQLDLIKELSFMVAPGAILTAIFVEGFYTKSWKRNLVVNIATFSLALSIVGITMSLFNYDFMLNPLNFLKEMMKHIVLILGVGWLYMGLPFCLIMTLFGGRWSRFVNTYI